MVTLQRAGTVPSLKEECGDGTAERVSHTAGARTRKTKKGGGGVVLSSRGLRSLSLAWFGLL